MRQLTAIAAYFLITLSAYAQTSNADISPLAVDVFAAKISQQTKAQVIDARTPEEFALNHITGAVNFNLQTDGYENLVAALKKDQPVFVYSIANGRSSVLAKDLRTKGFTEVYELAGGIGSWVGAGKSYYTSAKKGLSFAAYKDIITTNRLVLVDIGSRYCGACKKVKPVLDSLRQQYGDAVKIVEIDLEESPQLITELKTVTAFPYLIVYKQGEIAWKRSGISDLKNNLDAAIAKAK